MGPLARRAAPWVMAVLGWAAAAPVAASGLNPPVGGLPNISQGWACPRPSEAPAPEVDALLQLADAVERELQRRGQAVALVSRSGLDLRRFGHRTSHAGLALAGAAGEGHRVRQLYFDCQVGRARIFDEGWAGFVLGMRGQERPRLSLLWWPAEAGQRLALRAQDDALAQALVGPRYRANAAAHSLHDQNCNQWVLELWAATWGGARNRAEAQAWLRQEGFVPSAVRVPWVGWLVLAALMPHVGLEGHEPDDLDRLVFQVVMPASLEGFALARWPQAQRQQWCLAAGQIVAREGGPDFDEGCEAQDGDRVIPLQR